MRFVRFTLQPRIHPFQSAQADGTPVKQSGIVDVDPFAIDTDFVASARAESIRAVAGVGFSHLALSIYRRNSYTTTSHYLDSLVVGCHSID